MKYPQPHSLRKYYSDDADLDRIHNMLKRGNHDTLKKYQLFLKPIRRKNNGHKSHIYR